MEVHHESRQMDRQTDSLTSAWERQRVIWDKLRLGRGGGEGEGNSSEASCTLPSDYFALLQSCESGKYRERAKKKEKRRRDAGEGEKARRREGGNGKSLIHHKVPEELTSAHWRRTIRAEIVRSKQQWLPFDRSATRGLNWNFRAPLEKPGEPPRSSREGSWGALSREPYRCRLTRTAGTTYLVTAFWASMRFPARKVTPPMMARYFRVWNMFRWVQ